MTRDPVTGLLNRGALLPDLERAFAETPNGYVAVFDLDRFVYVNHQFGHGIGDATLCYVAALIADNAAPARAYRFGGDEFVVVGAGLDGDEGRMLHRSVVDQVRLPVSGEKPLPETPPNVTVTISGGVATWPDPAHAVALDVLHAADRLMYEEKRAKHELGRG